MKEDLTERSIPRDRPSSWFLWHRWVIRPGTRVLDIEDHLLKQGELVQLANPLEIVLAREVLEFASGRPMALASVLARRPAAPGKA